ncbi:MAG: mechanosensitive ion channel family protein [Verrucomicrobia bacterium]|nr:mechanosensitive ion channel family protein [Verrucomicrobiota bacterium]
MPYPILQKTIASAAVIAIIYLIFHLLKFYAKQTQKKFGIRKSRYFATRRLLTTLSMILSLLALFLIWNVSLKNVWISATGILAMIAVAFFAVWSLIGNILAGIILYFTSPFKIEDTIEVMPDNIRGTVMAINTFYTVLLTEEMNYINVPNSMFFQKYIQVLKNRPAVLRPTDEE